MNQRVPACTQAGSTVALPREPVSWAQSLAHHSPQQVGAAVGVGHDGRMFLQEGKSVGMPQGRWWWGTGQILGGGAFQVILYLLWKNPPSVAVGGVCRIPRCRLVVSLIAPGDKTDTQRNVRNQGWSEEFQHLTTGDFCRDTKMTTRRQKTKTKMSQQLLHRLD